MLNGEFLFFQIYLLGKSTEKEGIPSYEDIFGNDDVNFITFFILAAHDILYYEPQSMSNPEDEEDEQEPEVEEDEDGHVIQSRAKRQKLDPTEAVLQRRERRMWEEKRKEILFSYLQFTYYSSSVR